MFRMYEVLLFEASTNLAQVLSVLGLLNLDAAKKKEGGGISMLNRISSLIIFAL